MRKTAIMKNDLFLEHQPGNDHVESPERLRVIYEQLEKPGIRDNFQFPDFQAADHDIIGLNHSDEHIARVAATAGKRFDLLDPDTTTSPKSYDAACLAVGAVVEGTRLVAAGEVDNCFALVRPPGHHAEKGYGKGFCLFNNVAIAARYAIRNLAMKRVLIVDWDLHHGNGTQHSFYTTDEVLYFSTHQYPYYPGTGSLLETGEGKGEGYTVNVPLPGGQGDEEFAQIFNTLLVPLARAYQPEMILVSAGFDIYKADPLGTMKVTIDGFAYMARVLLDLADELCRGRLLVTLEGGYNVAGQRDGVLAVLAEMTGKRFLGDEKFRLLRRTTAPVPSLENAQKIAKTFWTL
ncbi:MAG: histone deacetylase [Desulfobulbaceae bacterium DB1]|nr:MAG: histone deacetylase [Desulfobulbaceae bacterium DB1]